MHVFSRSRQSETVKNATPTSEVNEGSSFMQSNTVCLSQLIHWLLLPRIILSQTTYT